MPKLDMILHDVRESFRQYHWDKWAKSSRRDAAGDPYHGDIFRWVRDKASLRKDYFQILTGAFVSHAALQKMRRQDVTACPFCETPDVVGSQEHIGWYCTGPLFHLPRLASLGQSPFPAETLSHLQRRMAFPKLPLGDPMNDRILQWFADARHLLLQDRWKD